MAAPRKKKKRKAKKTYRFQLTLSGIIGIAVVSFCLFLWMFLLGIWAGQTILLPTARPTASAIKRVDDRSPVATLDSRAKKKPDVTDQKK